MRNEEFTLHAHVHRHADGSVHNHYHRHPGGQGPHEHGESLEPSGTQPEGEHAHEHAHEPARGSSQAQAPLHSHCTQPDGAVVLRATGVGYSYPRAPHPVFHGIDLEAYAGSVLAILGNNGAGKSTLLGVLSGVVSPDEGAVEVGGRALSALSRREAARHVAYVAQQQRIPRLSVYDQVLLGRRPHVSWSIGEYDRMVVARTIEQMGLGELATRPLDELSGGERQKVYLARALAQEPEVLLLDEPTSALDPRNQIEVLETICAVTRAESIATVLVIHDINLALRFCDRFVLMRDGAVVASGGRDAVTAEALSETYHIDFSLETAGGMPVAVPRAVRSGA